MSANVVSSNFTSACERNLKPFDESIVCPTESINDEESSPSLYVLSPSKSMKNL